MVLNRPTHEPRLPPPSPSPFLPHVGDPRGTQRQSRRSLPASNRDITRCAAPSGAGAIARARRPR
eukprot:CAMPEP_0184726362 /NCGR_PEP_ID=MMETSP0314-20130426/33563_1 /TAXON_ID=38298 /ORGANISM="Rhodella maculata, Strain CCMP 736" /LENGTH=64 /DNA_ID=CAMNT_0027191767 /DNA_START=114 /DNA_END=305 /DNA_ORIENTATION=+